MAISYDVEHMLQESPLLISQWSENPLRFEWIHTPGHEECEAVIDWFDQHGLLPFIAQQGLPGHSEFAGYDFTKRPDLAVLFKLRFL